jgi:hypothetical protein
LVVAVKFLLFLLGRHIYCVPFICLVIAINFLLFLLGQCCSPNYVPERLAPTGTVPSPSSRMPARGRIPVSALGPSALSVARGRGRGRYLGHRRVVPSVDASLPSWILGNPVAVSSVRLLIPYVQQQTLNRFPHVAVPSFTVPSWAYVSRQFLCTNLISFLTLLINLHPQMLTTNIFFLCWPCCVRSLRTCSLPVTLYQAMPFVPLFRVLLLGIIGAIVWRGSGVCALYHQVVIQQDKSCFSQYCRTITC